jgi:hypothetical protein
VCIKLFSYLCSASWCVLMLNDALKCVYVFLKARGEGVGIRAAVYVAVLYTLKSVQYAATELTQPS